jgi:hypothetical protein
VNWRIVDNFLVGNSPFSMVGQSEADRMATKGVEKLNKKTVLVRMATAPHRQIGGGTR